MLGDVEGHHRRLMGRDEGKLICLLAWLVDVEEREASHSVRGFRVNTREMGEKMKWKGRKRMSPSQVGNSTGSTLKLKREVASKRKSGDQNTIIKLRANQ